MPAFLNTGIISVKSLSRPQIGGHFENVRILNTISIWPQTWTYRPEFCYKKYFNGDDVIDAVMIWSRSFYKLDKNILAATKQLNKWYFLSVYPSVRLSHLFCSHHLIIMNFSAVITNDQGKVHAKGQGQKSKVKVTEVTTQLNRFGTVTPVWTHIWWNNAYSLMLLRRVALLFFKVIRQISRSHGSKIVEFDPDWA